MKEKEATIYYSPKTDLGKRLIEIRSRIVASGETLLDWDDLNKEITYRRGEKREGSDGKTGLSLL